MVVRLVASCLFAALVPAWCVGQWRFSVSDIGNWQPNDIGNDGMAEGWGSTQSRSLAWDSVHGTISIPPLNGDYSCTVWGLNDGGVVAGYSDGPGTREAITWDRVNGTRKVPGFDGYGSNAFDVNDSGEVVGQYWRDVQGTYNSYIHRPGQGWSTLDPLYPEGSTQVLFVNNSGVSTGHADPAPHLGRGVYWTADGRVHDLGLMLNQTQSDPTDINDAGVITGSTYGPLGNAGFVRSTDGAFTRIVNPVRSDYATFGIGVNNAGLVLARYIDTDLVVRGCLWTPATGSVPLNGLLDGSGAGWDIQYVMGINDSNQIVGVGKYLGHNEAFVLNLVPEPPPWLAFAALALLLGRRRDRKTIYS